MTQTVDQSPRKKQVPLRAGVFTQPSAAGEAPRLLGGKCPQCGDHFFPKRKVCPGCGHEGLDEVLLGPRGQLWSFTIARQKPPGALVDPPYAIGQVRLPEGVVVQALLTESDPEKLRVGMDVEMILAKMGENEDGDELIAFKFRPV